MSYGGRPEHVEHGRAQRPDVGRGVATLTGGHLGRQVGRRAGDQPGLGQGRVGRDVRDAEVGDLHPPAPVDQDVGRLDVAVHDPGLVGGDQAVGRLPQQRRRLVGVRGPSSRTSWDIVVPSTYSMTSHWASSSTTRLNTATTCGWLSRAASRPHARHGRGRWCRRRAPSRCA